MGLWGSSEIIATGSIVFWFELRVLEVVSSVHQIDDATPLGVILHGAISLPRTTLQRKVGPRRRDSWRCRLIGGAGWKYHTINR